MAVLPFEAPANVSYGTLRASRNERKADRANDMLIAAPIRTLRYVLVTNNEGAFRRIANLRIENWPRSTIAKAGCSS